MKPEPQGAETLRHRYLALLADYEVDAELDGEAIHLSGEAEAGHCPGLLEIRDIETGDAVRGDTVPLAIVELSFALPTDPVPRDRLAEVALWLSATNPGIGVGQLELDPVARTLRYRSAQLVSAAEPGPDGLLMAPLLEALNVIDEHHPALIAVIEGAAAGQVFAEGLLDEAAGEGVALDEATRAALVAWLEAAGDAYRAAGDSAREAALAPLVRRVFAG